jgi:flagellar hook protein FlgE
MLGLIYTGMSGLGGFADGMRVISNNLTNVNTPGFKSGQLQFSDVMYQGGGPQGEGLAGARLGGGLTTLNTLIDFAAGDVQPSSNPLDLALDGEGFFVFRDGEKTHYGRNGKLQVKDGWLMSASDESLRVAGLDDLGRLVDVSTEGFLSNPPKVTTIAKFAGNLSYTASSVTVNAVQVIDAAGGAHTLKLTFKSTKAANGDIDWTVAAADDVGPVDLGPEGAAFKLQFDKEGKMKDGSVNKLTFTYAPAGTASFPVVLDFSDSTQISSYAPNSANGQATSPLKMDSQDGHAAGGLIKTSVDAEGYLAFTYSNGEAVKGPRIALARFEAPQDATQTSGSLFDMADARRVIVGHAGEGGFAKIQAGFVEGSNVKMEDEFGRLIVMQRGYQASSHVVTVANEMMQVLLDMKGRG